MILLDTHALIWLVDSPEKLSKKAQKFIQKETKNGIVYASSFSIWEIYMLIKKGRLVLSRDVDSWVKEVENLHSIKFIPLDNQIAAKSVNLPDSFHDDPADRIIVATAREFGATLITIDQKIRKYPHVQSLW